MNSFHRTLPVLESGLRWAARLLTIFLLGLVLVIFAGEGFNPFKLSAIEAIQMTLFFTTCIGMAVAWRWEVIGGLLSAAGIVLFFCVEFTVTGEFPRGLAFHLMLLPGILFATSGIMRQSRSGKLT
jgi:hypothetical protein